MGQHPSDTLSDNRLAWKATPHRSAGADSRATGLQCLSNMQLLTETQERVLYVTLNRPQKRNALSRSLLGELKATFEAQASNHDLVAAVLRGSGEQSFAAGGDLADFDQLRSEQDGRDMALLARAALDAVRSFPVPVVAALNGDALGGGAELAVSCDFRIAAAGVRIGFIQGRLAISTAWGGGVDLFELVGKRMALRLLSRTEMLDAVRAHEIGLVDTIAVAPQTLEAAVEAFIAPLRVVAPQVQRAFKALALCRHDRLAAERTELNHFAKCWAHPDHWVAHDRFMHRKQGE